MLTESIVTHADCAVVSVDSVLFCMVTVLWWVLTESVVIHVDCAVVGVD